MTLTDNLHFAILLAVGSIDLCFNVQRLLEVRAQRKADAEYAAMLSAGRPDWKEFEEFKEVA
jgi:hypothetical protein